MSRAVSIRSAAERDIEEAARWYESQQPGLGDSFLDEFLALVERISEAPLAFAEVRRSARRAMFRRFPFGVFYRITEESVVVLAVMHSSRDPRRWMLRV